MLLDQAHERGIRDTHRIEARAFRTRVIGAAAAQGVEAVTRFNQKHTDLGTRKFALQSAARGNVTWSTGLIEKAFAGFERAKVTA